MVTTTAQETAMFPKFSVAPKGLVVDDDSGVLAFATAVLEGEGYTIESASDVVEALHIARWSLQRFDFLVTDYEIGSANGLELAAVVRQLFPSIQILVMSGRDIAHLGIVGPADAFLPKPFNATVLRGKLRQLLQKDRPAA